MMLITMETFLRPAALLTLACVRVSFIFLVLKRTVDLFFGNCMNIIPFNSPRKIHFNAIAATESLAQNGNRCVRRNHKFSKENFTRPKICDGNLGKVFPVRYNVRFLVGFLCVALLPISPFVAHFPNRLFRVKAYIPSWHSLTSKSHFSLL